MPDPAIVAQTGSPLTRKLAQIMVAVERVPKRGRNSFFGYQYATEADVADVVRKELAARQVVIYSSVEAVESREAVGDGGKTSNFITASLMFTLVDGESGEERSFRWAGAGQDRGEKGLYKAITGAEKYFLLKLFLIPTGDDPEDDAKDHGQNGHRSEAQAAGKPAAATLPATELPHTSKPVPAVQSVTLTPREPGEEPPEWPEDNQARQPEPPRTSQLRLGPASPTSPIISDARAKRAYAIGIKALGTKTALRDWLAAHTPYTSVDDILVPHYATICTALEAMGRAS